jgi:hypothetical protein
MVNIIDYEREVRNDDECWVVRIPRKNIYGLLEVCVKRGFVPLATYFLFKNYIMNTKTLELRSKLLELVSGFISETSPILLYGYLSLFDIPPYEKSICILL